MVYKHSGPDGNDHDETEDRFDSDDASRSIEDPEVLEPSEISTLELCRNTLVLRITTYLCLNEIMD